MNRIPSGIPGFDPLVDGGLPQHDLVLLSGVSGSGKTIFGLQYISQDKGIFVTFEDEIDQLHDVAESFGISTRKLEKEDKLRVLKYDPFQLEDILEIVENAIREIGAKRIVFDSVSALGIYIHDPGELRRVIVQINNILRRNNCSGLLISEIPPNEHVLSRFGMEEFVADGVVVMRNFLAGGIYRRGLTVWKMRATAHHKAIYEYEITSRGLAVTRKIIKTDNF